ncbi:MAG: hypothetical protein WCB04_03115 [Mycobacteriales bacterium]
MSQSIETNDDSARSPGVVTTALQALRLPMALALLAYLVLRFLISLFRIFSGENYSSLSPSTFADRASEQHGEYLGLFTLLLLVALVFLVAAGRPLKQARPLVLSTLILTGIGLLLGFIGMLAYFFTKSSDTFNSTRDKIEGTLLDLPVLALYVLFALFLLALIGAKGLPRAVRPERAPQYGQGYPGQQGGVPGFPPVEQQQQYGGYPPTQQGQSYDPWQGYPQQGYQPPAYQPEPQYQPPQQWAQPPGQPAYGQPDPVAPEPTETRPVDIATPEDVSTPDDEAETPDSAAPTTAYQPYQPTGGSERHSQDDSGRSPESSEPPRRDWNDPGPSAHHRQA